MSFLKKLKQLKLPKQLPKLPTQLPKMGDQAAAPVKGRPMKFPYTFSAKLAQFPYKFYYKNQWGFRYYLFAFVACIPVFKKIQDLANSPENVAKWDEIRRKEASEHH